jgi:hypothetical protein
MHEALGSISSTKTKTTMKNNIETEIITSIDNKPYVFYVLSNSGKINNISPTKSHQTVPPIALIFCYFSQYH